MKGWRFPERRISGTKCSRSWTWLARGLVCTYLLGSLSIHAAEPINLNDPVSYFTNVASRLLQSELGVDLSRIQIYPTNQYTPAVHRLLQVAANVFDAATNRTFNVPDATNGFPSVFRPIFFDEFGTSTGSVSRVWIVGYSEVTNIDVSLVATNLAQAVPFHDLNDPGDRRPVRAKDMVYGVPLIIGAKKGFPNFNEFGLLQDISVARNLIFHRAGTTLNTNQVYRMAISNVFAVEAWNSYGTPYPRNLEVVATVDVITKVTNEFGQIRDINNDFLSATSSFPVLTNIAASTWNGYVSPQLRQSFVFPLGAISYLFLTNSDFAYNQNRFVQAGSTPTDPPNFFPIPQWRVLLSERVRFALLDLDAQRIVDYVNITEQEDPMDIAQLMQRTDNGGDATCNGNFNGEMGSFFCTNRTDGSLSPTVATWGIINQFAVSFGSVQVSDAFWRTFNPQAPDRLPSQDMFRRRILGVDTTTDFEAPFVPRRVIHQSISWQANDPLVHYMASDLQDLFSGKRKISYDTVSPGWISATDNPLIGFPLPGQITVSPLNQHFRPWGGNPLKIAETVPPTSKRMEIKDPLVNRSDAWNFPTNGYPNLDWIGKVHRGTPWQTLFLKATNVDLPTWTNWTGITDATEAQLTMPTNDWRVASLIVSMLNTNDPHHLFSVNQPNPDAWRVVLDGLTVLTNIGPSQFDTLVMSSNSPQAALIGTALDAMRANQLGQYFYDVGDILGTAELSTASPWLNTSGGANSGITDEAYEKIPVQLLPLLRPDSIGMVTETLGGLHVRFSGIDGCSYGVQVSTNLINWATVSTNYPTNGFFYYADGPLPKFQSRFCRSILLP